MTTRHLLDSSTLLYAVGEEHPLREPCHRWLTAATEGIVQLEASVEAGQEFLFHRMRRVGRTQAAAEFEALDGFLIWHAFDAQVLRRSAELTLRCPIGGRDAVHAATALEAGFSEIISADSDFEHVPGLTLRHPTDLPAD